MSLRILPLASTPLSILALLSIASSSALADEARQTRESRAAVFTSSNDASSNTVVAFDRDARGELTPAGSFATGGKGTGSNLGSQGALAIAGDRLLTVNAGSNDVSVFGLESGTPVLLSRTPSGGTTPISLTVRDDLVYVLNAGGSANVSGFWLGRDGSLHPLAGSSQPVSGAGAVDIGLDPEGRTLVVSEKVANQIETYALDARGRAQAPVASASSGQTPFGFDFTPRGDLIVSEAFGGGASKAAVSSYGLSRQGTLRTVSASVPDTQTAACWLVVGEDGRYAFTANAGSGDLSAYAIDRTGALTLVGSGVAAQTGEGSHPVDLAFAGHGRFLYALASGAGTISGFGVSGGTLSSVTQVGSLPLSVTGLAAR